MSFFVCLVVFFSSGDGGVSVHFHESEVIIGRKREVRAISAQTNGPS